MRSHEQFAVRPSLCNCQETTLDLGSPSKRRATPINPSCGWTSTIVGRFAVSHPQEGQQRRAGQGVGATTPVGQYLPAGDSPRGCADMAGSVWQWCGSPWGTGPGKLSHPYRADDDRGRPEVEEACPHDAALTGHPTRASAPRISRIEKLGFSFAVSGGRLGMGAPAGQSRPKEPGFWSHAVALQGDPTA